MTEKRFWLVPMDYYGEPRFVKDKKLIGEKSMSNQEVVDLLNEQDKEIQKLKQKVNGLKSELTIWKEDANEHIQETNKLFEENKQLKEELGSFEQVSFTDLCDKSRTILYMKKENVGDSE